MSHGVSKDLMNRQGYGRAISQAMESENTSQGCPIVFVFTGESNSGGIGLNSQATPSEMRPRPSVQIMNLVDEKNVFEALQLGVNNLRGHVELALYYDTCHGLENGLADSVESNSSASNKSVYLIKTGQGASLISQWKPDDASGYWSTFMRRIEAARHQLPADPRWVVWFSLGINDAIGGTPITMWKQDTLAHLQRMKAKLPGCIIVITQFQSMNVYPQIDNAIQEIAAIEPGVYAVDSIGATLADSNHWDYSGLKTLAKKMFLTTEKALESQRTRITTG